MDRFIARENIRHFRDLLWSGDLDPAARLRIQKMLIEEEDKLGADLELLGDIERHIADGERRIEKQRVLISTMADRGHDGLAQARILLDSMM